MPLSEHEQKVLQAMEQALYAEDPRFATHITNHGLHPGKRRIIVGVLGVVIGLALVLLAAFNALIWLGAIGFALMVAGGAWAFTPARPSSGTVITTARRSTVARACGGSGMAARSCSRRQQRRSPAMSVQLTPR